SGTVVLPAPITLRRLGPITKPPSSRPMIPGSRARSSSGGPTITTRNRTRNSHAGPVGELSLKAAIGSRRWGAIIESQSATGRGGRSSGRVQQRDRFLGVGRLGADPGLEQPRDRAVGSERAHRRVDRL